MSDYENIVISAVRYALGRCTYIVNLTVNYVIKDIENKRLSNKCLCIILSDIQHTKNLGMDCDIKDWTMLKNKIEEIINESI